MRTKVVFTADLSCTLSYRTFHLVDWPPAIRLVTPRKWFDAISTLASLSWPSTQTIHFLKLLIGIPEDPIHYYLLLYCHV